MNSFLLYLANIAKKTDEKLRMTKIAFECEQSASQAIITNAKPVPRFAKIFQLFFEFKILITQELRQFDGMCGSDLSAFLQSIDENAVADVEDSIHDIWNCHKKSVLKVEKFFGYPNTFVD